MKQTILTIIKENVPLLLDKFDAKPFMVLTIIFIVTTGIFGKLWYNQLIDNSDQVIKHSVVVDSLKNEIKIKDMIIHDKSKHDDVNAVIDSTLKTLIINNLIKKN